VEATVARLEPLCVRVEVAGELLGLKRSKMWELVARGAIRSVKLDGTRLIPVSELRAFAERIQADPETAA
jgi:excisionase family DNA binding protein